MSTVEVKNVYKTYQDKSILRNISMKIKPGEVFGLIGPSGVGKSTLLKIISAQTLPDKGTVKIFGCNIDKWDNRLNSDIGIMSDNIGCYNRMTCYENLNLYCQIYGLQGLSSIIIKELLNSVDLLQARDKKVSELSKGMKQRLLFARALLNSPKLVILDEPTSDLDPNTVQKIHAIIKNKKNEGTAFLITTHNMQEAATVCDHIGIMYHGEFVECGEPDKICRKHGLKETIWIRDKNNNEYVFPHDKSAAKDICQLFSEDMVSDIGIQKPDLNQVFLKLTGCKIDESTN